jgi:hypothetical protein
MTWVQRLIQRTCSRLGIIVNSRNNSIEIGSYAVKIVDNDPTYTIRLSDFSQMKQPFEITDIFYDDLEQSLESLLKRISNHST